MLVLGRRPEESVVFELPTGEVITVWVLNASAKRVRVGIEAPDSVKVVRDNAKIRVKQNTP